MPVRRRRTQLRIGPLEIEHFGLGCHLLAISDDADGPIRCWICDRGGIDTAKLAWTAHRQAVADRWPRPFPCYASVALDKVPLPSPDPAWREIDRQLHRMVARSLERRS